MTKIPKIPPRIEVPEAMHRIERFARWLETVSRSTDNTYMLYQLGFDYISHLVGPDAIHNNESLKTKELFNWAENLITKATN